MVLSFSDLINYLKSNQFEFYIPTNNNLDADIKFQFASLKAIIPYGFYFFEGMFNNFNKEIKNSLIITNADVKDDFINTYVIVKNPQLLHYELASYFSNNHKKEGIHETAIVSPNAKVSEKAYIGPFCILEDCEIEAGVELLSCVTVRDNVLIKENTIIEGNSVIGARGMAWIWKDDGTRIMQPQIGGVIIESNCIIGTDITIVRGSLNENTIIGSNTIIAHGTKIGHGCIIGKNVHTANNVSLAGNAHIGERTFLGSACTISSNVTIAANCIVGAGAVVSKSVDQEYATIVGIPGKVIKINNFENKPKGVPKPFKKK